MNKRLSVLFIALLTFLCSSYAQHSNLNADENMDPSNFALMLKDEWTFLRDETDNYLKATATKDEFETTKEFEARKLKVRSEFLKKIEARINDNKLNKRMFGVLLKSNFNNYDADAEVYTVSCSQTIEAPYDIPMVECNIPANNYVGITDTVERGFRKSEIILKFNPNFSWHVSREIAKMAKSRQETMYFRIHFVIDVSQDNFVNQCVLRIVPKDICLIDIQKNQIYWRETM